MRESLSLIVKNDRSEIPRLAQVVTDFCGRNRLSSTFESDLNLALEEIVVNVMRHGYEDQGEHDIAVTFQLQQDELTVRVEDDGRPFNPLEAPAADISAPVEQRRAGGLGIHFVKSLMDQLQYQRSGNKNVLVMKKNTKDGGQ